MTFWEHLGYLGSSRRGVCKAGGPGKPPPPATHRHLRGTFGTKTPKKGHMRCLFSSHQPSWSSSTNPRSKNLLFPYPASASLYTLQAGFEVRGVSRSSSFPPQKQPRSSEAPCRSRFSSQLCKALQAAQRGDRGHRDLSLHQTSGTALLWPSFPAQGRAQPVFIALARGILELTVPGADV